MKLTLKYLVPPFLIALTAPAQVTYERLLNAGSEPGNWLTYSGNYKSWRYSTLDQINRGNVSNLKLQWVYQIPVTNRVETTPIVADGVMYITEPPSNVIALDPANGRQFWHYKRSLPSKINVCCDAVNRGVAILGDRVYIGTVDAHLVALSAKTGAVLWDVEVADHKTGHAITSAPLAVKDMIVIGISGGEYGVRGFIDAYDARTGQRRWRFYTIPATGEKGNETWPRDSWQHGGGPAWLTGSYDPELNLLIWGTGNPSPDWNGDLRKGDNLYSDSAVALDADTGKMKWHFQFVPHDTHDFDAVQIPVLVNADWQGRPRKLIYWAHRGGFFYVLDRETGQFLLGKPFAKQTWAKSLDAKGRPIPDPAAEPTEAGITMYPGTLGATNWYSPSFSPLTNLFYLSVWENKGVFQKGDADYEPGNRFIGSVPQVDLADDPGAGYIRALNPRTGDAAWEYKLHTKSWSGVFTTAGGVLFGASGGAMSRDIDGGESYFFALDNASGRELWRINLGGEMSNSAMSYLVNGKQMITMASGSALFTFALP